MPLHGKDGRAGPYGRASSHDDVIGFRDFGILPAFFRPFIGADRPLVRVARGVQFDAYPLQPIAATAYNTTENGQMTHSINRIALGAAIAAATLAMSPAHAGNATANLAVQAQVNANCTISTSMVDFGSYDPVVTNAASAKTGSGAVTVACTKGSAPTIGLGLGSNASGSARRMTNGTDMLSYELYLPPNATPGTACGALTTIWGTSGANLFTPTSPANTAGRTFNVCGSIAGGQNVGVGTYSDTVVATVNF